MTIVIMATGYNRGNDSLNIEGGLIPCHQTIASWPQEANETHLAYDVLASFQELCALQLTSLETSLFLVIILMQDEKTQAMFTEKLRQILLRQFILRYGDETVYTRLMELLPKFKKISNYHLHCLNNFRIENQAATLTNGMPRVQLPDLYEELFSLEN